MNVVRSGLQLHAQIKRMQEDQHLTQEVINAALKRITGVIAKQIAWPGTQITILDNTLTVKAQTSKAFFVLVKKEINVFAYKPPEDKKKKEDSKKETKANEDDTEK